MTSIESRIAEAAAALSELEARVAEQAAILHRTPSAAAEATMNALKRSLELGRRHLQFQQEKLKAGSTLAAGRPAEPAPTEIAVGEDPDSAAAALREAERHLARTETRLARQAALAQALGEQGYEREAAEADGRLRILRRLLDLAQERLRLERDAAGAVPPLSRDQAITAPTRFTEPYRDARVIEVADVQLSTGELDFVADGPEDLSELEKTSLTFAQEEQKKGSDPEDILKRLKGEYYPLHLYNSEIEQRGYSFGLRLPRDHYLLYREQLSDWSVAPERPDWL